MGGFGISRDEVLSLLGKHVTSENLMKHMFATEAVMRKLAERLGEVPERWGLVGLSHDIDFDETKNEPTKHTLVGAEILRAQGVPEEYVKAIVSHNEKTAGWTPQRRA